MAVLAHHLLGGNLASDDGLLIAQSCPSRRARQPAASAIILPMRCRKVTVASPPILTVTPSVSSIATTVR
jgi:hypothetical protein